MSVTINSAGCVTVTLIHVVVDRTQWPGYVCAELNLGVSKKGRIFRE